MELMVRFLIAGSLITLQMVQLVQSGGLQIMVPYPIHTSHITGQITGRVVLSIGVVLKRLLKENFFLTMIELTKMDGYIITLKS